MRTKSNKEGFSGYYEKDYPIFCDKEELSSKELDLVTIDPVFCMLPWIHLHGYPNGTAYPCCDSVYEYPVGNLNEKSINKIINDKPLKEMRRNMLVNKKCKECEKCYQAETHDIVSLRKGFNKTFGHHIPEVLADTHSDGQLDNFKMRYFDIRFSNLCNLRCRTCGDIFSSAWTAENNKRFGKNEVIVVQPGRTSEDIMDQIAKHLPYLEQIYFAGGEPLMMPEHYEIIAELVRQKMFHVRLAYNTNFTRLEYSNHDILNMWKLFEDVSVGASLDAEGERAEYMRAGTNWDMIIKNRKRMLRVCPNVNFYISATVSIFNVWHIADFHKHWTEEGLINAHNWYNNILQSPMDRRVDVLPSKYKDLIREKLKKHIEWLNTMPDKRIQQTIIPSYKSIISMMDGDDKVELLAIFFQDNNRLDNYRNEIFEQVFPEYIGLSSYVT